MNSKEKQERDKEEFFRVYDNSCLKQYKSTISKGLELSYLELRSIDSLTPEDIKSEYGIDSMNIVKFLQECVKTDSLYLKDADTLRKKGFLIPFREYTEDQILEMGWAKIAE